MFSVPEFRDAHWCARVRAAMDRGSRSAAEIVVDAYHVDDDARRAWDVDIDDATLADVDAAIADARPRISRFFSIALTRNEGPGLLRYERGGFYRAHVDTLGQDAGSWPRRISVILFLTTSGEQDGGALRLHTADVESGVVDVRPVAGMLVAFPSTCLHEVLTVTGGVRDAIVDWLS